MVGGSPSSGLKRQGVPWTEAFASVGTGDKSFVPLQSADLLAHESWRHLKETISPTGRPMRKSLKRLLQRAGVKISVLAGDAYDDAFLDQVKQYIRDARLV
jgi:hypothetical protein